MSEQSISGLTVLVMVMSVAVLGTVRSTRHADSSRTAACPSQLTVALLMLGFVLLAGCLVSMVFAML